MTLPAACRRYFWEYAPDQLSWPESRDTIVRRLLRVGDLESLSWLRSRMTDAELRNFIRQRQGCGLEPRHLRFWAVVLDIPRDEVDAWIADAQGNPWFRRTH